MPPLDYVVSRGDRGWLVTANGIDCGVVADRATALLKAMRWARENLDQYGRHVRVLVSDGITAMPRWESGELLPALRQAATAMRRPSSCFVRELAEVRPLYIGR